MFGLLSIAVTFTYLPPICSITFAYSFSAATAAIGAVELPLLEDAETAELDPIGDAATTCREEREQNARRQHGQEGASALGAPSGDFHEQPQSDGGKQGGGASSGPRGKP